jgi:uroporphyrinogen decarboxylase
MTPKDRAIAALELRQPDDIVPTFELEFQLTDEFFKKGFKGYNGLSGKDLDMAIGYNADFFVEIVERLDYSIIRTGDLNLLKKLVEMGANKKFLLCGEADGTMGIPDGKSMVDLSVRLFEQGDEIKKGLEASVDNGIAWGRAQIEAGAECLTMCADYCFNDGPFLSPNMFAEFVTPYLHRLIEGHRNNGAYVIKHTDGNIMPILDQLVSCRPHALHSVDPQAKVSLAEVKKLVGDKVCLAGNVNCGLLQTGTDEEVRADVMRALRDGMPGGGYIFCTSNVAFKGMPPERYQMMLDLRQKYGRYDQA